VSAVAGWYPDPGGGPGLFRFWDGQAWSAATSANPGAAPPSLGLGLPRANQPLGQVGHQQPGQPYGGQSYGSQPYGSQSSAQLGGASPSAGGYGSAYAGYPATRKKTPLGWWLAVGALLLVVVVVAVFVVRGLGGSSVTPTAPSGQPSENACPQQVPETTPPLTQPADGRVHGGKLSYPRLGSPWGAPQGETRVPFGSDVASQEVMVEQNYSGTESWVASVLVGELQAGDGFFTPQQGAQIVVKCILGAFYGDNEVQSNVKVNRKATIDGHDAWLVESQLSFDIPNLVTKGELLIVAIVSTGSTAGLYYASIPDTVPQLVQPARDALRDLKVDS